MKIKTLLIAPYPGLKALALELAKNEKSLDLIVRQADLDEAVSVLAEMEQTGIELIISRGGTAKVLRQHTTLPVIEIQVSGYDILRVLTLVRGYNKKVHLIGFPNICQGVISVSGLLNMDISYTMIHHQDEVEKAILVAKAMGAEIILGDTITFRMAEKHGLQGMLITSGREALLDAFQTAKQVYEMLSRNQKRMTTYERVLHALPDGLIIFNQEGRILFVNQTGMNILGETAFKLETPSIFKLSFPWNRVAYYLKYYIEQGQIPTSYYVVNEDNYYRVSGRITDGQGSLYYMLIQKVRETTVYSLNNPVTLVIGMGLTTSFNQMVKVSAAGKQLIQHAKKMSKDTKPVALIGERGTGKQHLASAIHHDSKWNEYDFLCLCINHEQYNTLDQIKSMVTPLSYCTVYLQGIERLSNSSQSAVWKALRDQKIRLIIGFEEDPALLVKTNRLCPEIWAATKEQTIYLPPLHERTEDIPELVRLFISTFNVKYGKQVVGVRPNVMEQITKRNWSRHIEELREIIAQLVQQASGDFIDEEVWSKVAKKEHTKTNAAFPINLDQPLRNIEREIIQYVLEKVNMNQSEAAKRLGINRTTLWRKLKS